MFDEQPDGDPHGECAAEIHRLERQLVEVTLELESRRTQVSDLIDERDAWREDSNISKASLDMVKGQRDHLWEQLAEVTREREQARQTAEYWKANHLAGNEELTAALAREQQLREATNALLHQIDIGTFFDAGGHSAKMLKSTHDAMKLFATKPDDSALKAYVAKEQARLLREMADKVDLASYTARQELLRKADELEALKDALKVAREALGYGYDAARTPSAFKTITDAIAAINTALGDKP